MYKHLNSIKSDWLIGMLLTKMLIQEHYGKITAFLTLSSLYVIS